MNLLKILPPHLKFQFETIEKFLKKHTNRAYLAGGGVRDIFLKMPLKDLDIEVYGIDEVNFKKLMSELGATGVGKSFFVYKFGDIDISLPRTEQKNGIGHKAFDVKICEDEKEAAKRRDFTMNSMMLSIFEPKLLDFYGGRKSIDDKIISLIDIDSFKEDSLRVLRGIQFSSRFGFKIDEQTLKTMDSLSLDDLSKTRIFWEFEKLFNSSYLHFGLYYLIRLNIFEKIFTCRVNDKLYFKIALELEKNKQNFSKELYPYYFIYIIGNFFKLDINKLLKSIDAPRHYRLALKNQPFFKRDISDKELMEIAIDLPIKLWLGNYKKGVKERAKKLNIFDDVYSGGVIVQSVISDGFEKEEIKKELRRRKLEVINCE